MTTHQLFDMVILDVIMILHKRRLDMSPEKIMSLCFLIKNIDGQKLVCLAKKKRGFRVGMLGGFGGKIEIGETMDECVFRETFEESTVKLRDFKKAGVINFFNHVFTAVVHVYISTSWEGEPVETEEVSPAWYKFEDIVYKELGKSDGLWIPQILEGKRIVATFKFDENDALYFQEVRETTEF